MIIELKNVNKNFRTAEIDRELNKFLKGKKSYLIKKSGRYLPLFYRFNLSTSSKPFSVN